MDYTIDGAAGVRTVLDGQKLTIAAGVDKPNSGAVTVVKAVYGDLAAGNSTDVTEKVAGMVTDGSLVVDATNDNFGGPDKGVGKTLKVDYTIGGVAASRGVSENETLKIVAGEQPVPPGELKIRKAVYGELPDGAVDKDVTEKVAAMVKDGALSVEASNDNFGDPAKGVGKKLRVDYTFDGAKNPRPPTRDRPSPSSTPASEPSAGRVIGRFPIPVSPAAPPRHDRPVGLE